MQPAQSLRALFLRRPAESRERALGSGDTAPRVLLVGQRYAGDHFAVGAPRRNLWVRTGANKGAVRGTGGASGRWIQRNAVLVGSRSHRVAVHPAARLQKADLGLAFFSR